MPGATGASVGSACRRPAGHFAAIGQRIAAILRVRARQAARAPAGRECWPAPKARRRRRAIRPDDPAGPGVVAVLRFPPARLIPISAASRPPA